MRSYQYIATITLVMNPVVFVGANFDADVDFCSIFSDLLILF
jgi:hypothetical protein